MNYCSNCGSKNLKLKIPEGDNRKRHICPDCGVIHYENPRIVVGCVPVWEDKVLLAKRAIKPRKGYWNLPAGFLENHETVMEGALRELREEARAEMEIQRIHCVYDLPHTRQVYIHFLGHLKSPDFAPGPESLEVRLFTQAEIPWDELAFSSTVFALEKYYESLETGETHTFHGFKSYEK